MDSARTARFIMTKRLTLLLVIGFMLAGAMATPASAQQTETWALGGGYFTLPNVDTGETSIDTSGMYASAQMRSPTYLLELDYSIGDPGFLALAADYLYPVSASESSMGGAYIGAGYTYFSCDDLDNGQGINIVVGSDFSSGLAGQIRYDMLGSDEEMWTFGLTYSFM